MEEKYFVDGIDVGYTWKQLLYWCYSNIISFKWDYDKKKDKYCYIPQYSHLDHQRINTFFKNFRHNYNDGNWSLAHWKDHYHYEWNTDENGRRFLEKIVDWREWIPVKFTPKLYQVTDSFGRIIPSGEIRAAYLKYIPNEDDIPPKKSYKYKHYGRYMPIYHKYEFRNGPVPGYGRCKKGYWHKYHGDHGSTIGEMRNWYRDKNEQKDAFLEYGKTFKMNGKRNTHYLDPWEWGDYRHNSKGRGWKRSRKKKQWM